MNLLPLQRNPRNPVPRIPRRRRHLDMHHKRLPIHRRRIVVREIIHQFLQPHRFRRRRSPAIQKPAHIRITRRIHINAERRQRGLPHRHPRILRQCLIGLGSRRRIRTPHRRNQSESRPIPLAIAVIRFTLRLPPTQSPACFRVLHRRRALRLHRHRSTHGLMIGFLPTPLAIRLRRRHPHRNPSARRRLHRPALQLLQAPQPVRRRIHLALRQRPRPRRWRTLIG